MEIIVSMQVPTKYASTSKQKTGSIEVLETRGVMYRVITKKKDKKLITDSIKAMIDSFIKGLEKVRDKLELVSIIQIEINNNGAREYGFIYLYKNSVESNTIGAIDSIDFNDIVSHVKEVWIK